jgi:nucleoside-diphosphate-sugar epimerase
MPKKQKLLLVGCGDLPTRLLKNLDSHGWEISGLRRSKIELNGVSMTYGDAAQSEVIEPLVQEQPDQILITLAPSNRAVDSYQSTYLQPAQAVAKAAAKLAPDSHLVFVSSTSVYAQNGGERVDEDSAAAPVRETAQILLQAEQEIAQSGNPWSVVRFSGIYGPGRERLLQKVRSQNFTPVEYCSWTNRIHSEDCTGILAHLLQNPRWQKSGVGVVIGTDNQPAPNTEVERWLTEAMGMEYPDVVMRETTPNGKRCENGKLTDSGYSLKYPNYRSGYLQLIAEA